MMAAAAARGATVPGAMAARATDADPLGVRDITVRFGRGRSGQIVALDEVTLDAPRGQVTAVVGGDGAGKSTLLRVLAHRVAVARGEVRTLDRARLGYQPATSGVWPTLTVTENVDFVGRSHGMSAAAIRSRADELLERAGLAAARTRLAGALSGGMRQKLGFVLAILHEPELVLLDEPSTGVDPVSRVELWRLIAGTAASGAAVLMATTYLDEAQRAASVLALDAGRTLACGTPDDIVAAVPGIIAVLGTDSDGTGSSGTDAGATGSDGTGPGSTDAGSEGTERTDAGAPDAGGRDAEQVDAADRVIVLPPDLAVRTWRRGTQRHIWLAPGEDMSAAPSAQNTQFAYEMKIALDPSTSSGRRSSTSSGRRSSADSGRHSASRRSGSTALPDPLSGPRGPRSAEVTASVIDVDNAETDNVVADHGPHSRHGMPAPFVISPIAHPDFEDALIALTLARTPAPPASPERVPLPERPPLPGRAERVEGSKSALRPFDRLRAASVPLAQGSQGAQRAMSAELTAAAPTAAELTAATPTAAELTASAPTASVTRIVKDYGRFRALDDVSLEVLPGEIVGLIGANGAGKTTLLRILLGLERADVGEVELFGGAPDLAQRHRIGYVPQGLGLYTTLSVRENVQFLSRVYRVPSLPHPPLRGARVPHAPWASPSLSHPPLRGARVPHAPWAQPELPDGLQAVWSRIVGEIGLGRQRQLAFALALAHEPDLLVLDEPTSGVDPLARARLWDVIHDQAAAGRAVIVTTHYLQEAEQCSRLALLSHGRMLGSGTVDDLIRGTTGLGTTGLGTTGRGTIGRGPAEAVLVRSADWQRAFNALDRAGLPVMLSGRDVRVAGEPIDRVRAALTGIRAEITEVPVTLEETVVLLDRRNAGDDAGYES
jgi:ABC-type multidrug transport system ATPase subunit